MSNAKRRYRRRRRRGRLVLGTTMFDGRGLVIYERPAGVGRWLIRGTHIPTRWARGTEHTRGVVFRG